MKFSETRNEVFKGFSAVRSALKQPAKDADNPYFDSTYVTLDAIEKAVTAAENGTGISHSQEVTSGEKCVSVKTYIFHSSGEYIEFEPFVLPATKVDAQAFGSATTYARRYSLAAAYGVVSDQDDDGNAATRYSAKNRASQKQSPAKRAYDAKHRAANTSKPKQAPNNQQQATTQQPTPQQRVVSAAEAATKAMGGKDYTETLQWGFAKAGVVYNQQTYKALNQDQASSIIGAIQEAQRIANQRAAKREA